MIRAIIIDDEELARKLIREYLASHPEVQIVAECSDGFEGVKAIQDLKPDLVFLDVQMPKLNGLEILELIDDPPEIIFSTAFDEYAIKAFEHNAVDYLLKPYSQKRFDEALLRAIRRLEWKSSTKARWRQFRESLDITRELISRIVVRSATRIEVIPIEKIIYIEAADDYVMIHTADHQFLKQKTLSYFEKNLPDDMFIRVHRSYIVAINQISSFEKYGKYSGSATLKNGLEIPISRSGMRKLREKLR